MRLVLVALSAAVALSASFAFADDEKIDPSTLGAITVLASRGYADPADASVRNVHKSKAKNGLGYCGEVSLDKGSGYSLFHVILAGKDTAASVLRLGDYPDSDQSRNAIAVRRLMVNFGCLELKPPASAEPDIR